MIRFLFVLSRHCYKTSGRVIYNSHRGIDNITGPPDCRLGIWFQDCSKLNFLLKVFCIFHGHVPSLNIVLLVSSTMDMESSVGLCVTIHTVSSGNLRNVPPTVSCSSGEKELCDVWTSYRCLQILFLPRSCRGSAVCPYWSPGHFLLAVFGWKPILGT